MNDMEIENKAAATVEHKEESPVSIDLDTLAALKAKLEAKKAEKVVEKEVKFVKIPEKTRGIEFGIVGSGQAGSKIAETFYKLGYDAVVMNTAEQDLKYIELPANNKLLLNYGLGGAAKSLEIGRDAAETHRDKIKEMIEKQLANCQLFCLCSSLGGGSGSGSMEVLISILNELEKPIIAMVVLPADADDVQAKHNSLKTLEKLLNEVKNKRVSNIFVVDNARLETLYSNVGQLEFFPVANHAVVEPLHIFNVQSAAPSTGKPLDPTELGKLLIDGEGLSCYGQFSVENYEEETALAEAVINNMNSNLLASGFDISQSRYVGFLLLASKDVWSRVKSASVNYAISMIQDACGTPQAIFRGMYEIDTNEDCVKVYSIFSGLGLPSVRIEQLTKEVKAQNEVVKNKDTARNLTLNLDLGKNETISEAQRLKDKISSQKSVFGKMIKQNVVDRRPK